MLAQFDSAVLEAVGRASKRAAAVVREELKDGVHDLATIASIAPFIGLTGTLVTFPDAFPGISGPRGSIMSYQFAHFAESLWFAAIGLLVGLLGFWCYQHLAGKLWHFEDEMEGATLDLLNQLCRFPSRFAIVPTIEPPPVRPMFGGWPAETGHREEKFFRPCLCIAGTALVVDWFVQAFRFFWNDSVDLRSAAFSASFYLPLTLAVCGVLVYPFWSRFLHRRPGALVAQASVLCLVWSVAELVLARPIP